MGGRRECGECGGEETALGVACGHLEVVVSW